MKKIRVMHLLASNRYSGAENVVCNIIQNCSESVEMYYCSVDGPIRTILKQKQISFLPLSKLSIGEVKKILRENQIDIIHAHDFQASFVASFFSNQVKVISHLHCNYKLLKCRKIVAMIYGAIEKKFSQIIVVSDEILTDASFGKKIAPKTMVLDNVVDAIQIKKKSQAFSTQNYDLIFVGRLIEIKQPFLFISIVKSLVRGNPNIKACMVGQGELERECVKKIEQEGLSSNIDFIGFQENPFPYIRNSKLAVLPSKFEGLPMSVIECMVLGIPVVNSGVGGLQKMFSNHQDYLCHTKDEYVQCIAKLLKKSRKSYQKDCEEMVQRFTDIKAYGQTIERIYKKVMK